MLLRLHALDTDVELAVSGTNAAELADAIAARWHLSLVPDSRDGAWAPAVRIAVGHDAARGTADAADPPGRAVAEVWDDDLPRLLMRLTHAVTYAVIPAQHGRLLMLHAAALSHLETGASAVFVAPGNTGKSTVCTRLGAGRGYLTDETVGVRRDGTIAPYGKPISTRRPDWVGVKDEVAPSDRGLTGPGATPWVAGIVLLDRADHHQGEPEVVELDTVPAIAALAPESSGFMMTDRPLTWLADLLEATGGARRVRYAQAEQLEPLVSELLASARMPR